MKIFRIKSITQKKANKHYFFNKKSKQSGQSLIEFVMLMVVLLTMSIVFHRAIKGHVKIRWQAIIKKVTGPPYINTIIIPG